MTAHQEAPRPNRLLLLSRVLAGVTVLAQITYPLVDGDPRAAANPALVAVTAVTVVAFGAASLTHAASTRGPRAAVVLAVVAGGLGLAAEALALATGYPFGTYTYSSTLGPQVLGVPLLVPLAWVMMAYPCLLAGRTVAARLVGLPNDLVAVAAAAWLLAGWDLFLDPQMVAAGHWHWAFPHPGLPGVEGVPLTNFAGWVLVAVAIQAALHAVLPERPRRHLGVPGVLLAWTWLGSTLANLAFFGRPAVAAYGFVAMGVVALPALVRWVRE